LAKHLDFTMLTMWACGLLYLLSVGLDVRHSDGGLPIQPSTMSLFRLGASGTVPVFVFGHYWSVLSAGWLHAGILHIALNMMSLRTLGPLAEQLYGNMRTVILWVVAGVSGFVASSVAGMFLAGVPVIGAGRFTVGASA